MHRTIAADRLERLPVPQALVGESPRWDDRRGVLFYVDILGRQLRRYDPRTRSHDAWDMDETVGGCFPTETGRLLLAMQTGIFWFTPESGALEHYCDLEADHALTRANDGRCDPQGRLWISTMDMVNEPRRPIGALYRLTPGGLPERIMQGLTIPNTISWNDRGDRMYVADTPLREVWSFDFDGGTGAISNRQTFLAMTETETGHPDGASLDSEGGLWIAMPQGARIERRMPDGSLDMVIETPCERPTMCSFGGATRDTLFITSLSRHLTDAEREVQPDEGAVFSIDPGVTGAPEPRFGA